MNLSSLVRSTIVAALGGLLFRFETAVIAGITSAPTNSLIASLASEQGLDGRKAHL